EVVDLLNRTIQKIDFIGDTLLKKFTKKTDEFENIQAPHDLVSLVKNIITNQASIYPDSKISLHSDEPLVYANFDKNDIDRAITNLIVNAIEAGEGRTHVSVKISKTDRDIEILITDNGRGIPVEIQKNIFQSGFTHGKKS